MTETYYKVRQVLQNMTSITKCDKKNCYKVRQVLRSMTVGRDVLETCRQYDLK